MGRGSVSGSARVWILPPIPTVSIASNVLSFDPSITPQTAAAWARYMVRDLIIESEARRSHDLKLAESGASDSTIMAIVGHLSRAMMERYSHIRMAAKQKAMESLSLATPIIGVPKVVTKVAENGRLKVVGK